MSDPTSNPRDSAIPGLTERCAELENALHGLSTMYGYAWDVVGGGLMMMDSGRERFEAAHREARRVLGIELMEVDEDGNLTPEHDQVKSLQERIAALESERDALKHDVRSAAIAPFVGMDREWTAQEKSGINDALRKYGWQDAAQAQVADYEQQCVQVLEEISSTKEQLGRAKAKASSTGDYSDSKWFHAANTALRHKQIRHQTLLRDAGKLRREIRSARGPGDDPTGRTFERQFMVEAKALLPGATYAEIVVKAQQAIKVGRSDMPSDSADALMQGANEK
jgi:hypothetical protein